MYIYVNMLTMYSTSAMNHSEFHASEVKDEIFNTQDRESFSVLGDLMSKADPMRSQNKNINIKVTGEGRISGYFCSDTIFNFRHRVLTETEIEVLENTWTMHPFKRN